MRKFMILVPVLALSACAQATDTINSDATPAKVQLETAQYFSTNTRNVRIGAFNRTLLGTEYKARVSGRVYNCHYIRQAVSCKKA